LAGSLDAGYLIIDFPISQAELARFPLETVVQNKTFRLFRLDNP